MAKKLKYKYKDIAKTYKSKVKKKVTPNVGSIAASKALKGNNFWMRRTSHGTKAMFTKPSDLYDAAIEYFEDSLNDPMYEVEAKVVGGKIKMVNTPKQRPFTVHGLTLFLGVSLDFWCHFKKSKTAQTEDFARVISYIEQAMYKQKFDGASNGFFNANIISRDLGLVDKSSVETPDLKTNVAALFPTVEEFKKTKKS